MSLKSTSICLLLMTLACTCYSSPVMSLVGGRQSLSIEHKANSPFPYVDAGLIAMWDGEWNSGFGIHDPEATVWKDLVGEHDLAIYGTVFQNFIRNTTTSVAEAAKTIEGIKTIEVCYCFSGTQNSAYGLLFYSGVINTTRLGLVLYLDGYQTFSNVYWQYPNSRDSVLSTVTATMDGCFVDGLPLSPISRNTDQWNNNSYLGIGGRAWQNTWKTYGDWYCIRLYDRVLSNNEIEFNSSVDKERFGMP